MSDSSSQPRPLKVLIVGGGIAGLTLANALEQAPVDFEYIVLESRDHLTPQLGAGIALLPHGSRILDQLGVYAELESQVVPVASSGVLNAQGQPLLSERSDTAQLVTARMSYPLGWIECRSVLLALAGRLRRKSCILTDKKVRAVEQTEDNGVTVHCTDGSLYHGDIVVGADGIRSTIRSEMWRGMEEHGNGKIDVGKERRGEQIEGSLEEPTNDGAAAMTAEYKCLFGISRPVPGLEAGDTDDTFAKDVSMVVATGQGGKVFWFLFGKMPRVYEAHEIPRFDAQDAAEFAQEHGDLPVRPEGTIKLATLWEAREVTTLVPLQEADFAHWTSGRIVCLGDSVHKMTPHTGAGGMLAIEAAAALSNELYQLISTCGTSLPTARLLETALLKYENGLHLRASRTIEEAAELARLHAMRNVQHRLLVRYFLPHTGDFRADQFCDASVRAGHIDYLPLPPRLMMGSMPFNPAHGMGKHESRWIRVMLALPLVGLAIAGFHFMFAVAPLEQFQNVLDLGVYHGAKQAVRIMERFYQVPALDDFARPGVVRFVLGEAHFFFQSFSLFADYGIWYAIMLIESARRANQLTILRFALLWGMLNMWGIAIFAPLYYFAYYVLTPISVFDAPDRRLTDISYTRTVLPVILASHYATFVDAHLSPVLSHRQMAGYLWELFPIWVCVAQEVLARYILSPSTLKQDRLNNVKRDLPAIHRTILVLCVLSAAVWQYTIWCSRQSLVDIFLPVLGVGKDSFSFKGAFAEFLKWDQVFFALANIFWIGLLMWDLKAAGMVSASWLTLAFYTGGLTVIGGNGTMLGLMWLYREDVLATRRHKMAVVHTSNKS